MSKLLRKKKLAPAFLERLILTPQSLAGMAEALFTIADLPDPLGIELAHLTPANGLDIRRVSVPLGVIAVIYESRPNVTADAAGLCLKSGNAVILRCGSDSFYTCTAIVAALHQALKLQGLPTSAVQLIPTQNRQAVTELLKLDQYIDVLIPRGGPDLIREITSQSCIPLFKHLAGLCHTYLHTQAKLEMAEEIILNAKMRRTGICGATEVLLVDRAVVHSHLPRIISRLIAAGCEVRAEEEWLSLDPRLKKATHEDFDTEFLAPILVIKVVADLAAAILHLRKHSTQHTEAIITEDLAAAERFFKEVDSAIVMHNTSTQFADGGEFGMGAEMGIATGKLHARGPVGAQQLTTFKYLVRGKGQLRP